MENTLKEFLKMPNKSTNVVKDDHTMSKTPLSTKKAVEFILNGTIRDNVCKFCLNVSSPLYELDQVFKLAGKRTLYKVTIRDMIGSFYPFQIPQDISIPDKICERCLNRTISSYLFVQQCDLADRAMRNCIEDVYEKFENLDPLERPKKRGRQKLNPNTNVLHVCYENVIEYAEPQVSLVNRGSDENSEGKDTINPLECPQCWQDFSSVELLMYHERTHPKTMWYHCHICGNSFTKPNHYRKHIKEAHPVGKELPVPVKNNMICKCKDCGHVSEDYISHLQHLEKHKFKTLMYHIIHRKMDKLCVVCLDKNSKMMSLNKTICMHGGYPEITGDRNLYNVLCTALPDNKSSHKYQELFRPNIARILSIKLKSSIKDGKSSIKACINSAEKVVKDQKYECEEVLIDDKSEASFEGAYRFSIPIIVCDNHNLQSNIEYVQEYKFTFLEPDQIIDSQDVECEATEISSMSSKESIYQQCKICWVFKKPMCQDCIKKDLFKKNDNILSSYLLNDSGNLLVNNELNKPCGYCWLFEKTPACNYCGKDNLKSELNTQELNTNTEYRELDVTKDVYQNTFAKKENVDINNDKDQVNVEFHWNCKCCLTQNETSRQLCFCCGWNKINSTNELINTKVNFDSQHFKPYIFGEVNEIETKNYNIVGTVKETNIEEANYDVIENPRADNDSILTEDSEMLDETQDNEKLIDVDMDICSILEECSDTDNIVNTIEPNPTYVFGNMNSNNTFDVNYNSFIEFNLGSSGSKESRKCVAKTRRFRKKT